MAVHLVKAKGRGDKAICVMAFSCMCFLGLPKQMSTELAYNGSNVLICGLGAQKPGIKFWAEQYTPKTPGNHPSLLLVASRCCLHSLWAESLQSAHLHKPLLFSVSLLWRSLVMLRPKWIIQDGFISVSWTSFQLLKHNPFPNKIVYIWVSEGSM